MTHEPAHPASDAGHGDGAAEKAHGHAVEKKAAGVIAEFLKPADLIHAAEAVRNAGYTKFDCFVPFPVHGLDQAMGIKTSILPVLALGAGIVGLFGGFGLAYWTNGVAYVMNLSGKPLWAWQANVPIAFETTVLLAALTTFLSVFVLNGLPELWHAVFTSPKFQRATSDRFVLYIEADDPRYVPKETAKFVEGLHPHSWETVEVEVESAELPASFKAAGLVFALLAVIPPLLIMKARHSKGELPRYHAIFDMDIQQKFKAQAAGLPMFADGRAARLPVAGTIARGDLRTDAHFYEGKVDGQYAALLPSQVELNDALVARGQQRFGIYCAMCHGYNGLGGDAGIVHRTVSANQSGTGWNPPTNLTDPRIVKQQVGEIFNTITHGIKRQGAANYSMPGYGPQIPPADRWAIAAYVRALQLSEHYKPNAVAAADSKTQADGQRGKQ